MDILIAAGARPWEQTAIELIESRDDLRLLRRCVDTVDLLAAAPDAAQAIALVDRDLVGLDADTIWQLTGSGVRVYLVATQKPDTAELAQSLGAAGSVDAADLTQFFVTLSAATAAHPDPRSKRTDAPCHGRIVAGGGPAGETGRSNLALGKDGRFADTAHERGARIDAAP